MRRSGARRAAADDCLRSRAGRARPPCPPSSSHVRGLHEECVSVRPTRRRLERALRGSSREKVADDSIGRTRTVNAERASARHGALAARTARLSERAARCGHQRRSEKANSFRVTAARCRSRRVDPMHRVRRMPRIQVLQRLVIRNCIPSRSAGSSDARDILLGRFRDDAETARHEFRAHPPDL
jgi:hypothetical protein